MKIRTSLWRQFILSFPALPPIYHVNMGNYYNGVPARPGQSANLQLTEQCFREAQLTDELCPASIKKYRSSLRAFFAAIGPKDLAALNNGDFDRFILTMKQRGASNARIANILATLKWIILRLERKGIPFPDLDLLSIRKPRVTKAETNYLTEREVEQFLSAIGREINKRPTLKDVRFMALAVFLLQTGARIGEALSIDITDIDRPNKEVRVIGKGSKPRTLFLRQETIHWIDRYLAMRYDIQPALFVNQLGTARWKQTDVGRSFRRYKKRSGIKKHFVIHTFRHTFATQYLMKGAGINVVQTALGHADPVTTLKYYAAAVEKTKVREMINDRHFDFLPNSVITVAEL